MAMTSQPAEIPRSVPRKESPLKVTGQARYAADLSPRAALHGRLLTSPHAHARISGIDIAPAQSLPGVHAVLTGADIPALCGPLIKDRPMLARDVVRYAGEPVALVVAESEALAARAAERVRVQYELLPALLSPLDALAESAPRLHPDLQSYARAVDDVYPDAAHNIASRYPIRKGNLPAGWKRSEIVIDRSYDLPASCHAAMEIRAAQAEIRADGTVDITTASQSPYEVAHQISDAFGIPAGSVRVHVPFVGGGFGGKSAVTLELLACLAALRTRRPVKITVTRHEDMATLPCRAGLSARIRLGARRDGVLTAAEMTCLFDGGAYADITPYMAKAIAVDGSGPYNIENLSIDACAVYTNRVYATAYRGYAHESATFCLERAMDDLARGLGMDSLALRRKNALRPGHLTATRVPATASLIGDLPGCIDRLRDLGWGAPRVSHPDKHTVRAAGCACFWKSPVPPTNAVSGALVTANADGTFNLHTGVVEMGSGSPSHLAQMFAQRLSIPTEWVHVVFDVDTRRDPKHYKTVASFSATLAGRAVLRAADDVRGQILHNAALAFACAPEEVCLRDGNAFALRDPGTLIHLKDLVAGYQTPDGLSLGEPVIGRGQVMLKGLSSLDPATGQGRSTTVWTPGVQMVEIEFDTRDGSYHILRACTVMDVGKVVNPAEQAAMTRGGMAMGLSLASREALHVDGDGALSTPSLRTYKIAHFGERALLDVDFLETPQEESPYGVRPMSEHGIIGMPAALANALAAAAGVDVRSLPVTPEALWRARRGEGLDIGGPLRDK